MTMKLLLIPAALVWIGLPALGAHVLFRQGPEQASLKDLRDAAAIEATRRYVAANPDAPAAMREGRQLAPVDALNADLAVQKAEFRVRAVRGTRAQFYEVS